MKITLVTLIMFGLALALGQAEESKCVPLKPGEVKAWESTNERGKHLYRRWGVSPTIIGEERVVMNEDGSVRGRVITTYVDGRPSTSVCFKGMNDPWFTEQWTWGAGSGYTVVTRTFDGKIITTEIFPDDDKGLVKTLDSEGNEVSDERYKEMADEVGDLLF